MELIGVQQVLSLSGTAEKIQQTTQQRGDIVNHNALTTQKDEDVEKSNANPPAELAQEARLQREKENKGGGRSNRKTLKKTISDDEESEAEEVIPPSDCGNVLDIVA